MFINCSVVSAKSPIMSVSPLTGKVKPSNNSTICDHLLNCNFLSSFNNFSVLAHENKVSQSLLIMGDKPSLKKNINSTQFYLFECLLTSFSLFQVSFFNLGSLFPSKYHYKIVKKKLLTNIKLDLMMSRDMRETRRRKKLIKNLD